MGTSSKSLVTFLAGAAAATVATILFKAGSGQRAKSSFSKKFRGIYEAKSPDWMDEIGASARTSTKKFRERIGL